MKKQPCGTVLAMKRASSIRLEPLPCVPLGRDGQSAAERNRLDRRLFRYLRNLDR